MPMSVRHQPCLLGLIFIAGLGAVSATPRLTGPAVASWRVTRGANPTDPSTLRLRLLGAAPGETKISLLGFVRLAGVGVTDPVREITLPDLTVPGAAADRSRISVVAEEGRLVVVESVG